MPSPVEVVDDLTPTVTDGRLVYTVRNPPYVEGSVSVFRNGMLQDVTCWTETDPVLGTVTIDEPILIREEEDHAIHIAYETFQPVYIDPNAPIHISRLKQGDVVRIAMKAGRHLNQVARKGQDQLLVMDKRQEGCVKVSGRAARSYSRTVFLGYITVNDKVNGTLNLQVEGRNRIRRNHLAATVRYSDIHTIRKYVTPGKPRVKAVPVSGAANAQRRPGALAKGVEDYPGFMNLVRVFF